MVQRVPETDPYPITPKDHGIEFLHGSPAPVAAQPAASTPFCGIRHEVIKAVRDYFDSHGFTLVDTPIFTPAACEGTTTLFEVDYFEDDKAYLTQSGQLYNEATAMAFGKVYCFGPTFRAEKSKTRRHLTRVLDGGAGNGLRHAGRRQARGRGDGGLHRRPRARKPPRGAEARWSATSASWRRFRRPSRA